MSSHHPIASSFILLTVFGFTAFGDAPVVSLLAQQTPATKGDMMTRRYGASASLPPGATTRVNVSRDGTQGNEDSLYPEMSADGRYVAFMSRASNLVTGDTNGTSDVFVHDRNTGVTMRVSVATDGSQGNSWSQTPAISADGRVVAFESHASNLVAGDTNAIEDVFVHDRDTGVTTRVSMATNGTQGNAGSYYSPALSADGRFVVFNSGAGNLVAGDTNGKADVFVHDRDSGVTTRVSTATNGTQGNGDSVSPALSADGRFVAFRSDASNFATAYCEWWFGCNDIFVHDRTTGVTTRVSVATDGTLPNGDSYFSALSADGRFVVFDSTAGNLVAGDTNGKSDVFVHDRDTGVTTRVSVATDGTQGNGTFSSPALSSDGRYVAFHSSATNMVVGDTNAQVDSFVHDRATGITTRVSVATNGTQGNGGSSSPNISADGQYVAFLSDASNLVTDDSNGKYDVFVHAVAPPPTVTGIAPNSGPTAGGTSVTLAGTGLRTGAKVTFGGTAATSVAVESTTTVTTTTPPHVAGTVDVVVTNSDGQVATLGNRLTYIDTPVITWANPASIAYGTPLNATQLNATASFGGVSVGGAFAYHPPAGTVLPPGTGQTLSVLFTPTDSTSYSTAIKTVTIDVTNTNGAPTFIDDPLGVGSSTVKVVHITELRQAIDTLRARSPSLVHSLGRTRPSSQE